MRCSIKVGWRCASGNPVVVSLLASSNPLSLTIYKVPEGHQADVPKPRKIPHAVGGIVKLDGKVEVVQVWVGLLVSEHQVLNGRGTDIPDIDSINFLRELVFVQKVIDCQLFKRLIVTNSDCVPMLMILQLVQHQIGSGTFYLVKVALGPSLRQLGQLRPLIAIEGSLHLCQIKRIIPRPLLLDRRMKDSDGCGVRGFDCLEAVHIEPLCGLEGVVRGLYLRSQLAGNCLNGSDPLGDAPQVDKNRQSDDQLDEPHQFQISVLNFIEAESISSI